MDERCLHPSEIKLLPAYPLAEAARYLGSNPSTLRAWFHGRGYKVKGQPKWAKAVLSSAKISGEPISFLDLVEAHVLLAIRKGYGIPLKNFRVAMEYLREAGGDLHFLAHRDFFHDRRNLYLKWENKLMSLSERGQLVGREIITEGLKQIVYGEDDYAARFFPRNDQQRQESIVLDPTINFGRPCLVRLGVGADAIAARFRAGERIADLAQDYAATREEVEEAIRWHERIAA
jgi:uncharacterized protein (DUF433 family)